MESKANYTIVGTLVLILAAGLLIAGIWLSAGYDQKTYHPYTVYVTESVSGLGDDSAVKYNGVRVGYVSQIDLDPINPQSVKLSLQVEDGTPITNSTYATLVMQGITGTTYLNLAARSPSIIPLQRKANEPYPVIPYQPSFFNQLEGTVQEISHAVEDLLNKENLASIKKSLHNLETFTDVIAANNENIDKSLREFPAIVKGLNRAIDEFDAMAESMGSAGKEVSMTMQSARNSINKITQIALPPTVTFLNQASQIAANLEQISNQMRQNPSIIIRGTKPPPPGPGE